MIQIVSGKKKSVFLKIEQTKRAKRRQINFLRYIPGI